MRDELLGIEPRDIDIEVHGVPAEKLLTVLQAIGTVNRRGDFTVYKIDGTMFPCPDGTPRPEPDTGDRRPLDGHRGSVTAARLHHQRHRPGHPSTWIRSTGGRISAPQAPRGRRTDVRRGQPSSPSRAAVCPIRAHHLQAPSLCPDLPRERILGRSRNSFTKRSRARARNVIKRLFPDMTGRVPAGPGVAPRGRRLDAHTDGGGRRRKTCRDLERPTGARPSWASPQRPQRSTDGPALKDTGRRHPADGGVPRPARRRPWTATM